MSNILVIDDEARHCQSLQEYLTQVGHNISTAGSAERGCELAKSLPFNAILLDLRLPGMDGLSAIPELKRSAPEAPIIVMTAFGTLETAVKAVQQGVFEYLVKPFSLTELKVVLNRALALEELSEEEEITNTDEVNTEVVIGRSPVMQRIFNRIALVASSKVPVLLTGESGTGKEVLARAIHRYSAQSKKRFLPIFLAALSPGLIESELFGHTRGAYTGAELDRPGLLEQAEGGTVLLDELGDIPLPLQVKLLRAIEEREITRVGEDKARAIDVRFIAATNKSLPDLISQGLFREDLYYRLSAYQIELPPLRERREDITDLAEFFLQRFSPGTQNRGFLSSAMQELNLRPWHGNIRELRNAVEHAAIASRGAPISLEHLPIPRSHKSDKHDDQKWKAPINLWLDDKLDNLDLLKDRAKLHNELLNQIEPTLIEAVLSRCQQNQAATARILGMDPKTLRSKIAQTPHA
ncbi:MAG: sigma-54 dependent transcriptional regulator [Gimesia sp.]